MLFNRSLALSRNFVRRQLVRFSHDDHHENPVPGDNLPFQIKNRYRLTAWFCVFIGSGLAIPFLVVRHQLKKQ